MQTVTEHDALQPELLLNSQTVPALLCRQDNVVAVSPGWERLTGLSLTEPCLLSEWESRCQIAAGVLGALLLLPAGDPCEVTLTALTQERCLLRCLVQVSHHDGCSLLLFTDVSGQYQAEQAMGQIIAMESGIRGSGFFDRLTRTLCQTLELDVAMIAEIDSNDTRQLNAISCYFGGSYLIDQSYDLTDTPCQIVLDSGASRHYPSRIQASFPGDNFLRQHGIESYLGFALEDGDGRSMGVMSVMSRQPMEISDTLRSMLHFVARRVESDLIRHRIEARLEVSQMGLDAAERLADMGSWVVDIRRQKVLISEQLASLYQLDPGERELSRQVTLQRVHPEDRELVQQQIADGERSGKPYTFDHRVLLPDGQVRWIRSRCEPVQEQGQLVRILGVSQDVTELTRSQRQAFESEQMQRRLLMACPYGIAHLDRDLTFLYVNPVAEAIYGYSTGELVGQSLKKVMPAEQWPSTLKLFEQLLSKEPHVSRYHRIGQRPDGSKRDLEVTLNYILDEQGEVQGFIGFLTDLTDRKADELRLMQLSTIVEQSPSSILITDVKGCIEYINPAFELTSGYSLNEAVGQTPRLLRSGQTPATTYQQMWQTITRGEPWRGELLNRRKDGSLFWELASIAPIRDDDDVITHFVSINEDITRLKDQEAQLAWQASYDPVTQLPNRVLAMERLSAAMSAARSGNCHMAVMFIDLDQFKRINDTFGHSSGDELLVRAAEKLKGVIGSRDTVARFGGDEFVVLLDCLPDLLAVERAAEQLLRTFSVPVQLGEHPLTVTASVGIAVYPQDGEDPETLLRHADVAMYTAKEQGRNCFHFFTPEMNEQAQARLKLESHLQHALKYDELEVFYQPVVALDSGEIVGAEALLRWFSPQLGQVPPDRFIPLAEDLGLIDELGDWVIEQVLVQYRQWRDRVRPGFRCAINVSPRQFQRGQLARKLISRLRYHNVPGSAIELEVTEGLLMHNWSTVDDQITELAAAGVSLSIDDFGTGYSSISYLRKYPFNTLKIDRSFVRDVMEDDGDATLVRSVIAMAHSMGLSIIAEGVETMEQYHLLRDAHCCMMQGYLFSKPVSAADFGLQLACRRHMGQLIHGDTTLITG
ncbi:MAG: EAL domain-containing protein [Marinobacterium sp.]|nr:EAL domain-containing protein [Marinobacterium sp.]